MSCQSLTSSPSRGTQVIRPSATGRTHNIVSLASRSGCHKTSLKPRSYPAIPLSTDPPLHLIPLSTCPMKPTRVPMASLKHHLHRHTHFHGIPRAITFTDTRFHPITHIHHHFPPAIHTAISRQRPPETHHCQNQSMHLPPPPLPSIDQTTSCLNGSIFFSSTRRVVLFTRKRRSFRNFPVFSPGEIFVPPVPIPSRT
jgi:hypothetical protein